MNPVFNTFIEKATILNTVEREVIRIKKEGKVGPSHTMEKFHTMKKLTECMDEVTTEIAILENKGYTAYDMAVVAKDLIEVDPDVLKEEGEF